MEPALKIQELSIGYDKLTISLKLKIDLDIRVRSPKVTAIFSNGVEERRLPVLIESVRTTEDMRTCVIYAKYTYYLSKIFIPWNPNDLINVRFALSYGRSYYEEIPFTYSRDIPFESELFTIEPNSQKGSFTIKRKDYVEFEEESCTIGQVVTSIFTKLYSAILFILALLLIPLFTLDAILSKIGISSGSKQNRLTGIGWYLSHIRWRFCSFYKKDLSVRSFKLWYLTKNYQYYCKKPICENRVTFLSSRRSDMTGNLAFVYEAIKNRQDIDIQVLLDPSNLYTMSLKNIRKLSRLCATSKVLLIDDFFPTLNRYQLREETKLIQLWHACGAFKTFGFSRLGKRGGPAQKSLYHRNYDYAIVSSKEIAKFYAEGFGIDEAKVIPTGIPRTDIFFDINYKDKVVEEFYKQYPLLKQKKILLFAPTFRGNGKESAYYPSNRFQAEMIYKALGEEYAILIKHHPFVENIEEVSKEYQDYIINMSDQSELNDLLFVTDVVVTDYSSLIFEASLLDIPMVFYAYDLNRYIATRDFYYEYELFVPGRIVQSQSSLVQVIRQKDFEQEKIPAFKKQFFDDLDGHSTSRVVKLIDDIIQDKI